MMDDGVANGSRTTQPAVFLADGGEGTGSPTSGSKTGQAGGQQVKPPLTDSSSSSTVPRENDYDWGATLGEGTFGKVPSNSPPPIPAPQALPEWGKWGIVSGR